MGIRIIENNKDEVENALEEAVKTALLALGEQASNYARANAPVDTGRLRNSIGYVPLHGEDAVLIGSNVEYAPYQELGTSKMAACNNGRGFLRPAINDHVAEYREIVEDILRNG